jgi:hypothetical protein
MMTETQLAYSWGTPYHLGHIASNPFGDFFHTRCHLTYFASALRLSCEPAQVSLDRRCHICFQYSPPPAPPAPPPMAASLDPALWGFDFAGIVLQAAQKVGWWET